MFRPLSEIPCQTLHWLWHCRLALGKVAILEGDPNRGKSLLALDLCARVTTGRAMPDGTPGIEPANVLFLNGEDGDDDTVRPRLEALGADVGRVQSWDAEDDILWLPAQAAQLDEGLARTQARLVVIDPIMAFLDGSVQAASNQCVRRALAPLRRLARKHRCVILLVRHLRKSGGGPAMYRGQESIAFVAACRSAWLLAADPKDAGKSVLAQVKNNLAPPQPSLSVRLVPQGEQPPTLEWLGRSVWSADALTALAGQHATPRARAGAFLTEFLAPGPQTVDAIWQAAKLHDLSERTLRRARNELEIRSIRVGFANPQTYWALPGQRLPRDLEKESADEFFTELEKIYPKRSPLEK